MAAEMYIQNKRDLLPSLIGGSTILPLRDLRTSNYLKEDVKNSNGDDCMEKSFVRIYKLSDENINYSFKGIYSINSSNESIKLIDSSYIGISFFVKTFIS